MALWFFTTSDDATTSGAPVASAPGVVWHHPTPHPADVRRGNVVVAVTNPDQVADVRALARTLAGAPEDAALRAAGQAVIVDDDPPAHTVVGSSLGTSTAECIDGAGRSQACPTIAAFAQGRAFSTSSPDDPSLSDFVAYWLGRASG